MKVAFVAVEFDQDDGQCSWTALSEY